MAPASWFVIGAAVASVVWLFVAAGLRDYWAKRYAVLERALSDANGQVGGLHAMNAKLARLCIDWPVLRDDDNTAPRGPYKTDAA